MAIRAQPGRNPDAAPRCPNCGYNLFGLTELRCPECGHEIDTEDELAEARLLAPRNAADRRVFFATRIAAIVGAVLWILGTTLATLDVTMPWRFTGFRNFRLLAAGVLGSLAYLFYEYMTDEPIELRLFCVGLLWFAIALVVHFA